MKALILVLAGGMVVGAIFDALFNHMRRTKKRVSTGWRIVKAYTVTAGIILYRLVPTVETIDVWVLTPTVALNPDDREGAIIWFNKALVWG